MGRREVKDGEWIRPAMTGYEMECCNCGVVHVMDFRIDPVRGFEMRGRRIPGTGRAIKQEGRANGSRDDGAKA
jgi:hypothetical protein